ncbi:MAG: ATP-dependent helicase [Chloroflexota bacterium]
MSDQPATPKTPLTVAQQAVVAHDEGPALVFAVAGAGKTTAMVHRIERLVREEVFPAPQILATSFGKGNERDLRRKLDRWSHCRAVNVRTLHALGRSIIVAAQKAGHWPQLRLNHNGAESYDLDQRLLTIAIHQARQRQEPYAPELETVDRHDFLSYVAACKGNLLYADLEGADLPSQALGVAGEAEAPNAALDWYLDLYRLYESVRLQRGVVTFADMLLTGWETLLRFPEVRETVQRRYQCVLVDEFQDINLAQSEILHQITDPHRNYMAIGDDDQTIYEWRGADPHFILDFADRYNARQYVIDDNFRSPAAPLVLANQVIAHNHKRAPKRLQLTRGFGGETKVHVHRDTAAMARAIVQKIRSLRAEGYQWQDLAVLVRLNAQTPYIEQGPIAAQIPFHVSTPFYNRYEIRLLVHYVRLAWVQRAVNGGKTLTAAQKEWFAEAWQAVYNRPKRYLSRQIHDIVHQTVVRRGGSPVQALHLAVPQASHEGIAENLELLAEDLAWLAGSLDDDAAATLRELVLRLDFKTYLYDSSGFPQTGEGRAAGVDALIDYARGKGTVLEFVQHLRQLARQKVGRDRHRTQPADAVVLSTIHGAKGLEWPVVFVAQCNEDTMPFNGQRTENLEEERRLFYVALTRSRGQLYLHAVKSQPLSPFLGESGWRRVIPDLEEVNEVLAQDPQTWQAAQALAAARGVERYGLQRYFENWWSASPEQRDAVAGALHYFLSSVAAEEAWQELGLTTATADFWRELAPVDHGAESAPFPGLMALLAEQGSKVTS